MPYFILALALLLVFLGAIGLAIYSRWIIAKPNEWLLVIENGQLRTAGIGLRAFKKIGQTIVRFPSSLQRVSFKAQQVTKEMQGIEVTGFVIWVINREEDGPFKAYKYCICLAGWHPPPDKACLRTIQRYAGACRRRLTPKR